MEKRGEREDIKRRECQRPDKIREHDSGQHRIQLLLILSVIFLYIEQLLMNHLTQLTCLHTHLLLSILTTCVALKQRVFLQNCSLTARHDTSHCPQIVRPFQSLFLWRLNILASLFFSCCRSDSNFSYCCHLSINIPKLMSEMVTCESLINSLYYITNTNVLEHVVMLLWPIHPGLLGVWVRLDWT